MANFNSHGQPLDGTGDIQPTPFDAHERVVRGTHAHSAENGYQPAEYEHQEFPKVIKGEDGTVTTVNGEPLAEGQSVADVLEQDGE